MYHAEKYFHSQILKNTRITPSSRWIISVFVFCLNQLGPDLRLFMSSSLRRWLNTLSEKPRMSKILWPQLKELSPTLNLTQSLGTKSIDFPRNTGHRKEISHLKMCHWRTIRGDLKYWRRSILTSKEEQRLVLLAAQVQGSHLLWQLWYACLMLMETYWSMIFK